MEIILSFPSKIMILTMTLTISIMTSQIIPTLAIQPHTSTKPIEFIRTSCKVTLYPNLCYNSLFAHANAIKTSHRLIANAALSVALDTAKTTSAMATKMSVIPGMREQERGAMRDCLDVLGDSMDELKKSVLEMGQAMSFGEKMNDIQTWVSAALTNEDTCMEGFGGKDMDGKLKNVMRGKIVNICHLTSNALALINTLHPSMSS